MGTPMHRRRRLPFLIVAFGLMGLMLGTTVSCKTSHEVGRRTEPNLDPGWPQPNRAFRQVGYTAVQADLPKIAGAEYVDDDDICSQCHEAYAKSYAANNVHRSDSCEGCHGPASRHVETRGKEPGLVFSFKRGDPAVRAEACLKCHEEDACSAGTRWRTSKHAQCGTTCVDCHRGHYDVPFGTPATAEPKDTASVRRPVRVTQVSYNDFADGAAKSSKPVAGEYNKPKRKLASLKGSSQDLGAVAPGICYRCHEDYKEFQQIAGPHQICGPNNFNCTTCHDAHGQILERSRKDLCLECHKGSPTMAWHMSVHELNGVACTDCHNPHPSTKVPRLVNISHTDVNRPKRLMMSVQEPESCYKCHPKIFALNALPSHHPVKEGKMVCSDCHDAHGQRMGNLKADGVGSVNQLCYKCHAEKTGPFAYPHPPVDENCAYCHDPHGTVANNLLKQPPTFLCLRCHAGHRNPLHDQQSVGNRNLPSGRADIDRNPALRTALYTDCTQCHSQIHGSDLPTGRNPGVLMR